MSRRILAAALPHLAAEARLRREGQAGFPHPFAVVAREGGALRLTSVNPAAAALGLATGLGLADARALCPALRTRPAEPGRLDAFRRALVRWAGAFSPLASLGAEGGADGDTLVLDATGCAHLFGGEGAMLEALTAGLAGLGLTARAAMADTRGAAWALAHHGPDRGAASPARARPSGAPPPHGIAPPGQTRATLAALPVAALRLDPETAAGLASVGLTAIGDLAGVPRGALARRFGLAVVRRLDQALGAEPEPVAPARALPVFATRLTLPEPIGLTGDLAAGLDRLLGRLCALLETHQMGARSLRLTARRVDGADAGAAIALARPNRDPVRLAALFAPKLAGIEAGFGIDALRLEATAAEPLAPAQISHRTGSQSAPEPLDDLLSRLGNRIGFDRLIRLLPAASHIPERAFTQAAAAWSAPEPFPRPGPIRPLTLFPPEPLEAGGAGALPPAAPPAAAASPAPRRMSPPLPAGGREEEGGRGPAVAASDGGHPSGTPPARFRWRGRALTLLGAEGPERIAPEWWWDDPAWRTGTRDYWRAETAEGPRLWLFHTPQADRPQWWAHGEFA